MPSFAKASTQAQRAVSQNIALGTPRHTSRDDGLIHSFGTARTYQSQLKLAAEWDKSNGGKGLKCWDEGRAKAYLSERAEVVGQKTLDASRQALQILPGIGTLAVVKSKLDTDLETRAITHEQAALIREDMTVRTSLGHELVESAGLRASEVLTLLPIEERDPDNHRDVHPDKFVGRENWPAYTVEGKGGLVREIRIEPELALRLEGRRIEEPGLIIDRGIQIEQHYNVTGGQALSQSHSEHSNVEFGWSTGIHGLRHTYAQERMEELQEKGCFYRDALKIVSEEMGHFRPEITEVYLR